MCYEVEGNINDVHTGTINFVNSQRRQKTISEQEKLELACQTIKVKVDELKNYVSDLKTFLE